MGSTKVQWPGIPDEHAMPFKNVEYLDDQYTWAEGEDLLDEAADDRDDADHGAWGAGLDEDVMA